MQLSQELNISVKRAMLLFYQLMSDTYIVNDIKAELAEQ